MDRKLNIDVFRMCRTCMKEITSGSSIFYLDYLPAHTHLTIRQKLNNCIPELDLSIVSDAVICTKCADAIKSFYEFKQKCLELEIQIKKYIQQVQHTGDVNIVEMAQFYQLHNRNFDTKFIIEDFEVPTEDIKTENLACDIDAFDESLDECTESNEPAYLHQPLDKNLDIKVKLVETSEDSKIDHLVCDTNFSNEANEGTESMEPSAYLLTVEKVNRQYVLFNTVENYMDDGLSAAEHSDINSSNISQESFSQNLSRRDINYPCYRCGHKAASKSKLLLHLKRHTPIHFYQKDLISKILPQNYKNLFYYACSLCNYLTKYKCLFSNHSRIHLTKNEYRHIIQRKDIQTKSFVTTIKVSKINVKGDKRKYINYRYNLHYFKNRSKHVKSTQYFGHQSSLKPNTKVNVVEKPLKCSICEYQCNRKANLTQHMRLHTGEKPFLCSACGYRCNQKSKLQQHIRIHTGEKPFSCSICEYQSIRKEHLKQHMLTHTGEKPFMCSVCEYQCNSKPNLTRHMRLHAGEKPFACSVCDYRCSQKSRLKRHIRIHTGEKPFSCSNCEYQCNRKEHLKQHIRTHTEEKPFVCSICEYQCKWKPGLTRHMRLHAGEKPFS